MRALAIAGMLLAATLLACSGSGRTASTAVALDPAVVRALLAERDTLVALPPASSSDTLIGMNRTVCYGTCPAYALIIQGDGRVFYNGHRYVERTGRAESRLDRAAMDGLLQAVDRSGILEISDTLGCPYSHTDAASALITVRVNGVERQIRHYHGCRGFAEREAILRLEDAIDSIVQVQQWIGR